MRVRFRLLPDTIIADTDWPAAPDTIELPFTRMGTSKSGGALIGLGWVLFSRVGIAELPDGSRVALYDTSDRRARRCQVTPSA